MDTDADGNNVPSPGDTLRYQLQIRNDGNQAATGVTLTDIPDNNTALVVGSVQTQDGTVAAAIWPGTTRCRERRHAAGRRREHDDEFRVTIVDPLPAGVTQVSNQAQVNGTNFTTQQSDDPTTPAERDPTVTAVTALPAGHGTKTATLFIDADGDNLPSPGDTLLYQLEFINTGNIGAPNVSETELPTPIRRWWSDRYRSAKGRLPAATIPAIRQSPRPSEPFPAAAAA